MVDVVISEFMDAAAVETLTQRYAVHFDAALVEDRERLLSMGEGVRALIVRNRTRVDEALLARFPDLEAVGRLGVGLDNIDVARCQERGIAVLPATGGNASAVAEYVITGMLMLRRGAYHSTAGVLDGDWPRQALVGHESQGCVLGLVGFGGIAREVARRAQALGMSVIAFDPFADSSDPAWQMAERVETLEALLTRSDGVSLHVPLTEQTRHLIDTEAIASLRPGSVLINTARGGIVDESALADALCEGRIGGAMLDVFEREPLPADSDLTRASGCNLVLTPHVAGVTHESNVNISAMTARNVSRVLEGNA